MTDNEQTQPAEPATPPDTANEAPKPDQPDSTPDPNAEAERQK